MVPPSFVDGVRQPGLYELLIVALGYQVRLCDACAAADEPGDASPEAAGLLADWADGAAGQGGGWNTSHFPCKMLCWRFAIW